MNAKLDVITKNFEAALQKYRAATGIEMSDVIRKQSRLVAEKIMKITPPVKRGATTEKRLGEAAVARDINKVFADLGNTRWENKYLDRMWRRGDFEGVKAALSKSPDYAAMPISNYERIFAAPIKNIHNAARGNKPRRVPKRWATRYAVGKKGTERKYIREVQKHVGRSKSGWLAAVLKLGGKAPQWVKRHGTARGRIVDNSGDKTSPYVWMENAAINVNNEYAVRQILKFQTRIMLKDIERILRGGKFRR